MEGFENEYVGLVRSKKDKKKPRWNEYFITIYAGNNYVHRRKYICPRLSCAKE